MLSILKSLLTFGTATTATATTRDASPAGWASIRDGLLALAITAATLYANSHGVPVTEGDTAKVIGEVAASAATIFGVVQYVRRKAADASTPAPPHVQAPPLTTL